MLYTLPSTIRNSTFDQLSREVDRMFEAASGLMGSRPSQGAGAWPSLNLWREQDALFAEAEIPGFRMEDIEVLATERALLIRGQRSTNKPENATPIRLERTTNRFERTLRMPVEIDSDAVEATLTNGVLRIRMPLGETARPRRVEIKAIGSGPAKGALPAGASESGAPADAPTA